MDAKAAARQTFESHRDALVALSRYVHAHPELKYEEELSSAAVANALAERGFDVTGGVGELPTAFEARAGRGPLQVIICAEYDALPGIGHACGHNLIAAGAVGAGAALATVADDIGVTVRVIGTPAEEGGGGKILLLQRGVFDGAHLALMTHPGPLDIVEVNMVAAQQFRVSYTGKEAHASAWPELGVNAADAITVAQVGIGLLRQHCAPGDQVHGIVTHGGEAPNIVPAHTTAEYMVRGTTITTFEAMRERVMRCFEAGALATGATLEVEPRHEPYAEMRHDPDIAAAFRRAVTDLGRTLPDLGEAARKPGGSTDMGNVSHAIPSIHPFLGIGSLPAVNHQPEFTAHCVTPEAEQAMADSAVGLAWTAIDCATDPQLRERLLSRAYVAADGAGRST
jgi:amidohydrolase